jgi:predicted dienelactone hydrolase
MRPIESLVLITLSISLILFFINAFKRPKWAHFLPLATILLIILHMVIEGYRWQMVPAYLLTFLIFIATFRNLKIAMSSPSDKQIKDRKWLRIVGATLGLPPLIISFALPILVPVLVLPNPTGMYAIGTKYLLFTDNGREIGVQVWYPATAISLNAEPEPYWVKANELSKIFTKRVSLLMPLPSYWLSHYSLTKTHSYLDAPIAHDTSPFPILIYSHGFFFGSNNDNTALMEELASHGYIAFAIAHPYDVPFFIYPDKTIKAFDHRNESLSKQLKEFLGDKQLESLREKLKQTEDSSEQLEILEEMKRSSTMTNWKEGISERIRDVRFLTAEIEKMNRGSGILAGKLDFDRLGILGLSYGATTAYGVCLLDKRFKAGVNMDGFTSGYGMLEGNLTQPFMFTYSENNHGINDYFYNKAENTTYTITIAGAAHSNYADLSLTGGFQKLTGQLGTIDGKRCIRIISDYVLAFFDKHLKGIESSLLDAPSPDYPEVEFRLRNSM